MRLDTRLTAATAGLVAWPPAPVVRGQLRASSGWVAASAALLSTDEYAAPLIAAWQRGVGWVGAVSFPLDGDFSTKVRAWAGYGSFVQTLSRWLAGEDAPPGLPLGADLDGERLALELLYNETWNARIAQRPPSATLAERTGGVAAVTTRPQIW